MKIAVMSDRPDRSGTVPDTFETSPAMLIFTLPGAAFRVFEGKTALEYGAVMIEEDCEAVVCGPHIGREAFDPIADAGITRFQGDGLGVLEALRGACANTLPIIPEYEGGPGCSGGGGECHDHDH